MPLPSPMTTSRRQTLGLALLSMAGLHPAAAEGKNKKKRKKKDKCDRKIERAVADRCGQQADFCIANIGPTCERDADPVACAAAARECCGLLGECDLPAYAACIQQNVAPPDDV